MNEAEEREEALFEAALRLPAEQRAEYLRQVCGGDADLRRRVEALLAAFDRAGGFLKEPAAPIPRPSLPQVEKPGDRIGRYKLLQQIGEGGMGVVYMAEQEEPVRRRVALKIIKLGMDTKQVVARFEAERQALALMDHPNIARVLDGGATETGRPYFVMELVQGVPITEFCDQNQLSTEARLKLFLPVCQAIQSAHQKGIIHRDLKPTNILVTLNPGGSGLPKVIDFGVAKAINQKLTEKTLFTNYAAMIGTPAYMSPEQAEMSDLDVDTRADIYGLGVLLYELLTGTTPFPEKRLRSAGYSEMQRIILHEEPERPSTRLSTLQGQQRSVVARNRGASELTLGRAFPGDLDWIVMKCLEKDRGRRYETANGLARDVERHLNDEPVVARPPSRFYRFRKAVRRNRLVFAAVTAVAAALMAGLGISMWLFSQEKAARQRARLAEQAQTRLRQDADALRRRAEDGERSALRRAYASDMNLAQQALALNNLGPAEELLRRYWPSPSNLSSNLPIDLRGWEWRYLWQQCHSDAQSTLCQKSFEITALAVSSDGQWLAVGEHNGGGLCIWNLRTRRELTSLPSDQGPVLAAFSPVEPLLAYSTTDGRLDQSGTNSLRLWNVAAQRLQANLPLGGPCRGLVFASDGKTLATSAGVEDQVVLWKIPEGQKLASFPAPQTKLDDGIYFAATRDLSVVAHAMEDGQIRAINLKTGKEMWRAPATDSHVTTLQFSPDGKTLASGAGFTETVIRLRDATTGLEFSQLQGHRGYVHSLVFWPDGRSLASASSDQTICLWDLSDPRQVPPPRILRGHKREVWRLALLPYQTTLVSGSLDGMVNLWDTTRSPRLGAHIVMPATFNKTARWWSFAPDSASILSLDTEGRVVQWYASDFQEHKTVLEAGSRTCNVLISSDGLKLFAGSTDGTITVWDLPRRTLLDRFPAGKGPLRPVQFLAQGQRLLVQHFPLGDFTEWDLAGHRLVRCLTGTPSMGGAFLSPDERRFFFVSADTSSYVSDLSVDPAVQRAVDFHQASSAALSPDGMLLAVASRAGYARLFDAATLKEIGTLRNFRQGVHGIGFSADGKRLVTCSDGQEAIKLWDVQSQQELLTLSAEGSLFHYPAFSPDDTLLAASSEQDVLHVWRAPSWAGIEAGEKAMAASQLGEVRSSLLSEHFSAARPSAASLKTDPELEAPPRKVAP
jgi:WD40 repeat protein/serine/threonine protein kinase